MAQTSDFMHKVSDDEYLSQIDNDYHRNRFALALRMLKRATNLQSKLAYDFGCGEGSFMQLLEAEGAKVEGCDPSTKLLAKNADLGGVEILEKRPASSIDILVALNVIPYLVSQEQDRFWREARRVVRPGGLLLQANTNAFAAPERRHFNPDPVSLPKLLRRFDFEEIHQEFYRYYPLPWTRMITGRNERVIDLAKLGRIPKFLKRRRCTTYLSLSKRSAKI